MNDDPLVSIIIPTYHRHRELQVCLEAFSNQEYRKFEVCVVNDGGPSVAGVVAGFRDRLDIQLLELSENRGHVVCRNRALQRVHGTLIGLCDDDDRPLKNHLTLLVGAMERCDLAYGDVVIQVVDDATSELAVEEIVFGFEFDADLLRKTNFVISSATLYRASLHDELGPFDEAADPYWDWDWMLRVAAVGRFERVPQVISRYRFSRSGNMSSVPERHREHLKYLCAKHGLGELPTTNFYLMAKYGVTW
jgi:glycosyltransferase involved in cell wall biosynthesis